MGYRFSLESANTVANLSFGKVMACYRDIYSSQESYHSFMGFLKQFNENIYSNNTSEYMEVIHQIEETMFKYSDYCRPFEQPEYDSEFSPLHYQVLNALYKLSGLFERCAVKSLLLPPMKEWKRGYDFMTSPSTLRKLTRMHEGESCLILQPQERPHSATIFDAFPNFDVALRQADLWPAVLFWDDPDNYVFIPIRYEEELFYLFQIIKYESKNAIREIKRIAENKKQASHYIFQLSDLHFGAKNIDIAELNLKNLVKSQLSRIEINDTVHFVITGDMIDSPKRIAKSDYNDFAEFLEDRCGQKPISVLGNHDINNHGLAIFHKNQELADMVGEYPRIQILEEPKVILLLFNSNTNGMLAEGEIGREQMSKMGRLLDDMPNIDQYLLIAVMHHHLLPIPTPGFYDKKWYKKILPCGFLEETLKLRDADVFLEWLENRNVKYVLHGHKHIPFLAKHNGINIISCGSSTGQITHKEKGKTYISYNLIKISNESVTCTQFAEEIYGTGAKNIRTQIMSR